MAARPCPCLRLVETSDCPSEAVIEGLPNCDDVTLALGHRCEGDGECGTSRTANNCGENHDVYERCASSVPEPPRAPPAGPSSPPWPTPPPPPPHPPFAPLPSCGTACLAGSECGMCLRPLHGFECPSPIVADTLPPCDAVAPGEQCEADGECSTSRTLNNWCALPGLPATCAICC